MQKDYPAQKGVVQMTIEEMLDGLHWTNDHFFLIKDEEQPQPTIEWILEMAESAVMR